MASTLATVNYSGLSQLKRHRNGEVNMTTPTNLQPSEAMIQAGIDALWEQLPGSMDELTQEIEDDEERNDLLSDTVVFIWQAMHQASHTGVA